MNHIKKFQNFVNEQTGYPNGRFEIIDAIKNTEPGKLLQRFLGTTPEGSTGKYTDFDKMFQPVKTGRVYIGGSFGGKPRIYYNNGRWCQESEASGRVYGQGCADTLEGILQFSVLRYVLTNLERGINKEVITQWINSNWDLLYKMNSLKDILDAYKKGSGMENMITDKNVIPDLSNYKKYEKFFNFSWNGYSLTMDMNPFKLDDIKLGGNESSMFPVSIKLSNKKKYSAKSAGPRWEVTVEIGADNLDEIDRGFLKGIRYAIKKWYELALKRSGANEVNLQISKQMVLSATDEDDTQANQHLYSYFIGLYKKEPTVFGRALNVLKEINPGMAKAITQELGEKPIEDLRKGSSLLGRFGMG